MCFTNRVAAKFFILIVVRVFVTAIALDLDIINEASGFVQAGILGGNFLKNYILTFDFENSKVIFVPIKK